MLMRADRFVAVLLFLALPVVSLAQSSSDPELSVLYTGKLYGYLRVEGCGNLNGTAPTRASLHIDPCIDPSDPVKKGSGSDDVNPEVLRIDQDRNAVSCFLDTLKNAGKANTVLVGMGDNFGPRLEARMERANVTSASSAPGPTPVSSLSPTSAPTLEWWKPRSKNPSSDQVKEDPVGCFLRVAEYDAVVPGREDFNLGPERIRNIANFLHDPASFKEGGKKVRMLGANLVFNVHYKEPGDPVPESQKKLDFNSLSVLPQFQMESSEPFLPTLRYVSVRVTLGVDVNAPSPTHATLPPVLQALHPVPIVANPSYLFTSLNGPGHTALCGPYSNLDALASGACVGLNTPEIYDLKHDLWLPLSSGLAAMLNDCSGAIRDAARDYYQPLAVIRAGSLGTAQDKCSKELPENLVTKDLADKIAQDPKKTKASVRDYLFGADIDVTKSSAPSARLRWRVNGASLPLATSDDFVSDQSYRFCLFAQQASKGVACQRLPIRRPLFQDAYAYVPKDNENIVIFGVVDPNLRAQLTDVQGSWLEANDKAFGRKVEIESVDPRAALMQAEDAFILAHPDAVMAKDKKLRKILLAEMDSYSAENLAASLPQAYAVDLTIAKADRTHHSPNHETIKVTAGSSQNLPALVPLPLSNSANKNLDNPLAGALLANKGDDLLLELDNLADVTTVQGKKKYIDKKLKLFPGLESEALLVGLACPAPNSLALPSSSVPPRMLGRLRCAAKEYLFRIAAHEQVLSAMSTVPSAGSEFTEAVLQIMRRRSASDLAVLESRELYGVMETKNQDRDSEQPDRNDPQNLRKFLDRIFWENATIQKLTVTGATLKKVIKQSDAYRAQEGSPTETVPVLGRPLLIAGLKKGPGKDEYFVNGKALDDNTQYSIAVSDRLLSVDSDYPDLRKDLAGKTAEILWYKAEYISFAVCQELTQIPNSYFSGVTCTPPGGDYHDYQRPEKRLFAETPLCQVSTNLQGPSGNLRWCAPNQGQSVANMIDSSKGISPAKKFFDSFALPSLRSVPPGPLDLPSGNNTSLQSAGELADQFQRTRRFQISELSFAFSTHNPDQNAQQLSGTFSSAVLSTVSQARSSSWDVKNTSRFLISHYFVLGHGLDAYSSDDIAFSSQDQDQTGAFPHKITLNKNQWAVVPYGLSWSFYRNLPAFFRRKPDRLLPDINLVLEPTRFSGQFIGTDNFITVSQGVTAGSTCNGTLKNGICSFSVDPVQKPTLSYSPRVGIRLETISSYFEFGSQNSRDWRIPVQYIFKDSSGTPLPPCSAVQLQSCIQSEMFSIDPNQPIRQVNTARWQSAFYIDSVYKLPVFKVKKLFYVIKNKGEYYWNNHADTQVLTKYDYTMTNSLSIPVFRNISVEPTAELFWYENKIALNDLFKRSYSIKLNYTIDWGIRRVKFREATKQSPFAQPSTGSSQ